MCNKWWDGYQAQAVVVMDDIAPEHSCLATQLKHWGDHYGCILESKGGALTNEYEWFIVTSQYQIHEVFTEPKACEAIKRRFRVISIEE